MTAVQEEIKSIYAGLETKLGNNTACHFLVLATIIHESRGTPVDLLGLITNSFVYNWIRPDYYVKDALAILGYATGKKWTCRYVSQLPEHIKDNEFTEEEWENPRTGFTHFRRRYVDTLINSRTVAEGYLKQYRIYTMEV